MSNLLKAEWYKLMNAKSFWGVLVSSSVLASVLLIDSCGRVGNLLDASLYNTPLLYFLVMIFAALFIGEEFENRTLCSLVSGGHSRGTVLFAKAVVYLTAVEVILAAPLILHGLACMVLENPVSDAGFLIKAAVVFMAILAMGMLPLAFAFMFKDIGKTVAFSLVAFFLMIFVLNSDAAGTIAVFLPVGQLRLLSLNEFTVSGIAFLGIDVVWVTVLYVISYMALCRSDLK